MSEDMERDTIPKEDVAAAFKAIEEAVDTLDEYVTKSFGFSCSLKHPCAVCQVGRVFIEQRRELGIEGEA